MVPHLLFFLSGISGLVYQVVWVRQLGNVFGNTVHSASLVTAVFMCGLGAGSYLAGAFADARRGRGLLAAYGWSEAAIGAAGVALAWLLPRLAGLSAQISSYTRDGHGWYELSAWSTLLRHGVAALLLLLPTLLMGGTLTLLIRHIVAGDLPRAGLRIGVLYGLNTAGAALGCLLTDFVLIPSLGLLRAQIAAACINGAVGVAAILLGMRADGPTLVGAPSPGEESSRAVWLTAVAIGLTGFAGMGMEIVWFRFLSGALGQYRAVYSLLLAVILVGLWIGSVLGGWAARRLGRPATLYIVVEALFVVSALVLLATFERAAAERHLVEAQRALGSLDGELTGTAQALAMLRSVLLLAGPPSVLMGAAFPLANANVQRVLDRVGRRAGALYLANTAGAVGGSLLAGFVLLPRLGAQGSVLVLAAAAGLAVVPLHLSTRLDGPARRRAGPDDYLFAGSFLGLTVALCSWGMLLPEGYLLRRSLGKLFGERLLAASEGPNELLAVTVDTTGHRRLWTNGHSMSSTTPQAARYMRAFAHVPLLSLEAPRDVLVICFGVGNTVHAASLHPSVTRIDLADLSRNILEHGRFFASTNGGILDDPRVRVLVNDGRQHLRMTPPSSYDLVTLEPPPIGHAGVSALYSVEFYELVRGRLRPGGLLSQWLPVEQLARRETLSLVRAFLQVFPSTVLLSGERRDLILLGEAGPAVTLDIDAASRRLRERPRVAADLERVSMARLSELAGAFVASADTLLRATTGAEPVTDDAPIMEYSVMSNFMSSRIPRELFEPSGIAAYCPACEGFPGLEDLAAHLRILGRLYAAEAFLRHRSFAPRPVEIGLPALLDGDDGTTARALSRSRYLMEVAGINPRGLPTSLSRAELAELTRFAAAHPGQALVELRLGMAHVASNRDVAAAAALQRAVDADATLLPAHLGLALAWRRLGRPEEAIQALRRAIELSPREVAARGSLCELLVMTGRGEEARSEIAHLLELDPDNGVALRLVCVALLNAGETDAARAACARALAGGAVLDAGLLAKVGL